MTPGALSLTARARPAPRLKGTAPCPPRGGLPRRAARPAGILLPALGGRRRGTGRAQWGVLRVRKLAQMELLSLKAKKPAANSTLGLQSRRAANDECSVPPATSPVLRCTGNTDPSAGLERNPRFKHNALLTQGQKVMLRSKLIQYVTRLPTPHAHINPRSRSRHGRTAGQQSKLGLSCLHCLLQVSGCNSTIRQTLHSVFPKISMITALTAG